MDFGLALASQEITATIESPETGGWGLSVAEPDYDRALEVIQLYRSENRGWPWQRRVLRRGPLFDWGSLAWIFLTILFFELQQRNPALEAAGVMDSAAVSQGQWWRLFTAICLHADTSHLAANAAVGLVVLGLTMGGYGTGVGLFAAFIAGAGGNVLTWLVHSAGHRSLGASGMVTGCIGLLATLSLSLVLRKRKPGSRASGNDSLRRKTDLRLLTSSLVAGVMLFVFLGLSPGTDVAAHFGGFVTGTLLGTLLTWAPGLTRITAANVIAGTIFCALVVATWLKALAGSR